MTNSSQSINTQIILNKQQRKKRETKVRVTEMTSDHFSPENNYSLANTPTEIALH